MLTEWIFPLGAKEQRAATFLSLVDALRAADLERGGEREETQALPHVEFGGDHGVVDVAGRGVGGVETVVVEVVQVDFLVGVVEEPDGARAILIDVGQDEAAGIAQRGAERAEAAVDRILITALGLGKTEAALDAPIAVVETVAGAAGAGIELVADGGVQAHERDAGAAGGAVRELVAVGHRHAADDGRAQSGWPQYWR